MNKNNNGAKNIVKIPTSAHAVEYNQVFDIGVFLQNIHNVQNCSSLLFDLRI